MNFTEQEWDGLTLAEQLDPRLIKISQPAWKAARCQFCAAGMPIGMNPKMHWTGNLNPPACTAPSEAEYIAELEAALTRNRQGYLNILEMRKLSGEQWGQRDGYGGRYGALTREEIETVIAEIDSVVKPIKGQLDAARGK